jgi:hypothetical protein
VDRVCLVVPVQEGKSDAARALMRELEGPRSAEYDRSQRALRTAKEVWFLAPGPDGDLLVAYAEIADFERAMTDFVHSREEFDVWFKERLADVTGVDFNDPPEIELPELLSAYEASAALTTVP